MHQTYFVLFFSYGWIKWILKANKSLWFVMINYSGKMEYVTRKELGE